MTPVIKPWLVAGLIIALAGNVLLSAVLIVKLSGFDVSKREAEAAEAHAAARRAQLVKLQVDVESLIKQKELLSIKSNRNWRSFSNSLQLRKRGQASWKQD